MIDAALVMELFDGRMLEFVRPESILAQIDLFTKTAKALDLTIPPLLLFQADKVIQ